MRPVVLLALVVSSTAVLPAVATTNEAVGTHKLIVAVKKTLGPAAEKKLAILVLISQSGGLPREPWRRRASPLSFFKATVASTA